MTTEMEHERLVYKATLAIGRVYSDVTVSPEQTLYSLELLREEVDALVQAVKEGMGQTQP